MDANVSDVTFVTCPACEGYGAIVVGHGRWPDGSENNEEIKCDECDGTGEKMVEGRPLTLEEALDIDAEKLAALGVEPPSPAGKDQP